MQFLKSLWKILKGFFHKVEVDGQYSRFLTSSNHFSKENNCVKKNAYLPPKSLKLSTFNTHNISESNIWKLAVDHVESKLAPNRQVYGRADIESAVIIKNDLLIDFDNTPKRHANIIGWPKEKNEQMMIAIELALESSLKLR